MSSEAIHYESPAVRIGKHEWRAVVYSGNDRTKPLKRYLRYEWRRIPPPLLLDEQERWQDEHDWPSYNFNDGTYAGLPKSLASKVWARFQPQIAGAINDSPINEFPLLRATS